MKTPKAQEREYPIWTDADLKKAKSQTLKDVYVKMQHRSRLEIPSVQDNWIWTMRWLEAEIKSLEGKK